MKEKHLYSFGEFTLNAEDHILTRGGENVPVTPKMFDLLLVFVRHPGRVLGKEFLLQAVWPDSFVEEGNITFNIRQLRKALDDDAQAPRFIETIPRRGYRFVAPVDVETTVAPNAEVRDHEEAAEPEQLAEPDPKSRRNIFVAAAAAIVTIGVLTFGGWLVKSRTSSTFPLLETPFKSEKLSTDGGVFHISLSPDGKNVVYTHRSAGKQGVWLRQLETSNNIPIIPPSDDFYGGLAISPDGNSVYFARGSITDPQLNVYRMPIVGGVPQKVVEQTQGWISISNDGKRISFVRCPYTDEDWCSLYVADSADGQNEKKLVTRPRPFRIGDNEISPDGKSIAFAVGQSRTSSNEFTAAVVDIETGVERQLSNEKFFNISYFSWLPDQSSVLMTAMQLPDRNFRIWQVDPGTGSTTKLTSDSETYSKLSMDAAGSLLVSTQVESDFRLMVFQADQPATPAANLGDANTVAFAADGRLYFSSARTGNAEIWTSNTDGSDQRQLTNQPSTESAPLLASDAKSVFFLSDRTGVLQIWQMNADGSNQRQVTRDEGGFPVRLSPDGEWLYYRSALNNTLRRVSVSSGKEEIVLREMGRGLVVSPDTARIAFSVRRGTESHLTVATLPEGQTIKSWRITGTPNVAHIAWSNDGQYIAYGATSDTKNIGGIWYQPINEDVPRKISDLGGDDIAELQGFAIAGDGKMFSVIRGGWKHDAILIRGLKSN